MLEKINLDEWLKKSKEAVEKFKHTEEKINYIKQIAEKETASLRRAVQKYQASINLILNERTAYSARTEEVINKIDYQLLMNQVVRSIEKTDWDGTESEQIKKIRDGIESVLKIVFDQSISIPCANTIARKTKRKINHVDIDPIMVITCEMPTTRREEIDIRATIAREKKSGSIVAFHIIIAFGQLFQYHEKPIPLPAEIAISQVGDALSLMTKEEKLHPDENLLIDALRQGMRKVSPERALIKVAHRLIKIKQEMWPEVKK